ncbi:MAG: hypothetical protein ACRCY8_17475 [Dermatophilaceae bacterium]
MTRALLLPSPLLPVVAYAPLADALARRGWSCTVAEVPAGPVGPSGPAPVLDAFAGAVTTMLPDVVLAHSNAGRYAPEVAGGIPVVFVDAALPPETGSAPLAPPALLEHLAALAGADGLLPPWTRWWHEDDVRVVVPDPEVLRRIRPHESRMPLAYFRSELAAPVGWAARRCAFLAFGDTYAEERQFAEEHGWPVRTLEGAHHLHHLVDPDAAAAAVVALGTTPGHHDTMRA